MVAELVTLENLTGRLMVDYYALKSVGSRFPSHIHCTNVKTRLILGSGSPKVCTDAASDSANSRTNEGTRRLPHNSGSSGRTVMKMLANDGNEYWCGFETLQMVA